MKEIRTCIVCKKKFNKNELFRIVLLNGKLVVDLKQKIQSRATYICKSKACRDRMKKQRVLNRAFKKSFSDIEYDEIINSMGKEE